METTQQDARQQLRSFVTSNFYVPDPASLEDGVSLLEHGIIDSTGVLEVIAFIEETFGIAVDDSEMLPENLDSIDRIVAFVMRKQTRCQGSFPDTEARHEVVAA